MVATAARIGFITQAMRIYSAGPDSGVDAKYGTQARDTKGEPIPTYFQDMGDVEEAGDARMALLSGDRRRIAYTVDGVAPGEAQIGAAATTVTVARIDDLRQIDDFAMIAAVSVDYETGQSEFTTWG